MKLALLQNGLQYWGGILRSGSGWDNSLSVPNTVYNAFELGAVFVKLGDFFDHSGLFFCKVFHSFVEYFLLEFLFQFGLHVSLS